MLVRPGADLGELWALRLSLLGNGERCHALAPEMNPMYPYRWTNYQWYFHEQSPLDDDASSQRRRQGKIWHYILIVFSFHSIFFCCCCCVQASTAACSWRTWRARAARATRNASSRWSPSRSSGGQGAVTSRTLSRSHCGLMDRLDFVIK